MIKKLIVLLIFTGCLINIAACSPFVVWKEEVKLNDGRVIVVQQKKRIDGSISREAWLTINLPEFSQQPIVWHENMMPLLVNINDGHLFVVGWPPTGIEMAQYGNQKPPYIGYVWDKGMFVRIPFDQIPEKIYTTNLLIVTFPPTGTDLLTIVKKNKVELNGDPLLLPGLKQLNPKLGCGCQLPN